MNFNHKPRVFLRFCLVLIFLAGSLIVLNSSILYADDDKESEEMAQKIEELNILTIENKGYEKDRKGPAEFEHVKHARDYQISCWECHHEYKNDQQIEQPAENEKSEQSEEKVKNEGSKEPKPKYLTAQNIWSPWGKTKKCSECHDPKEKKDDVIMLQAAYHRNCKTCHKDRKIFDDDVLAYRKCTGCHK